METPKRLTPRADVTRRLYLAMGNRCAFPQCEQALMGSDAVLVGEIAHIEGALPDSARFNAAMTNEQRRHYDNLLLMCGTHHTVIDSDETTWTVAKLKDLKRAHEATYTAAIDKLRQQVGDVTDGVTYTPAANGLAILDGQGLDPNELEVCPGRKSTASRKGFPASRSTHGRSSRSSSTGVRRRRATSADPTGQASSRSPSACSRASPTALPRSCGSTSRSWSTSTYSNATTSPSTAPAVHRRRG
jgi:hypothetical protein